MNYFPHYINLFCKHGSIYVCSLHVNGSYWQTGWESRIIDLNELLIHFNQRGLLISLNSGSVDLLSL